MKHFAAAAVLLMIAFAAGFYGGKSLNSAMAAATYERAYLNKYAGVIPADYIVFEDGGVYKAKNNDGMIEFEGSNLTQVVQATIDELPSGGIIWLKEVRCPSGLTLKEGVTLIEAYHGTLTFYGLFGHTPQPGLTEDHPVLRFVAANEYSKPIIEWRDEDGHKIAWIVAHDKLSETETHRHISIETVKADMSTVVTRLEITYGEDIAKVRLSDARLQNVDGDVNLPAYSFRNHEQTGMYYDTGEGALSMAYGATRVLAIKDAWIKPLTQIRAQSGSSVAPAYSFDADPQAGMWYDAGSGQLKLAFGGSSKLAISGSSIAPFVHIIPVSDGSVNLGSGTKRFNSLYINRMYVENSGCNVAVAEGTTSITIILNIAEPNTNYGVSVTPSWNTNIYVTDKTTTSFTIMFSEPAPSGGGTIDWLVFH